MSESQEWAFPADLQPSSQDVRFDLKGALDAVVSLRSEVPDDAFTASVLGTERTGSGVVIRDDGLVLTIGYLVTEAEKIWLTTNQGIVVGGHPLAYDVATGFGLVQPLGRINAPMLRRGHYAASAVGEDVVVIGHGGREHALKAQLIAKREFAGYWEYVLDEALFTAPPHPQWGGAALVDSGGRLVGIG
jgi:S1-C subfamily serine protease